MTLRAEGKQGWRRLRLWEWQQGEAGYVYRARRCGWRWQWQRRRRRKADNATIDSSLPFPAFLHASILTKQLQAPCQPPEACVRCPEPSAGWLMPLAASGSRSVLEPLSLSCYTSSMCLLTLVPALYSTANSSAYGRVYSREDGPPFRTAALWRFCIRNGARCQTDVGN